MSELLKKVLAPYARNGAPVDAGNPNNQRMAVYQSRVVGTITLDEALKLYQEIPFSANAS